MTHALTLYGLKACDSCRKARRALEEAGHAVLFVDVREEADLDAKVPDWLRAAPQTLINKSSTTWRALSVGDKARAATNPAALLKAHPTLIKRPVIETTSELYVGWSRDVQQRLLTRIAAA